MKLRIGYELTYAFPQPTPVILVVNVHESRAADLIVQDDLVAEPHTPIVAYRDLFGNRCHFDRSRARLCCLLLLSVPLRLCGSRFSSQASMIAIASSR